MPPAGVAGAGVLDRPDVLLHVDPGQDEFGRHLQRARQAYLVRSPAMRTSLAENYVGLPLDWGQYGAGRNPVNHPAVTPTP